MSNYSAHVLYDASWRVLIARFGDVAALNQPQESLDRLSHLDHASQVMAARNVVRISPELAALIVGVSIAALNIDDANIDVGGSYHAG